jgi:hypothetical protein
MSTYNFDIIKKSRGLVHPIFINCKRGTYEGIIDSRGSYDRNPI